MRPEVLRLQAFGPFRDREIVDFTSVDTAAGGLFLIAGDTGAGKSTLLDAMCYALFDDLPQDAAQRAASSLRSQHAPADQETEIEFEFRLHNKRYRITRTPSQLRPRKRGGGLTEQRSRATFVEIDEHGEIVAALAAQPKKATQCVEELVGFSARQFRQIVVLPQGQFDRFLAAGSDQREQILAELFNSDRYQQIEAALRDAKTSLEKRLTSIGARREALLQSVEASDVDALSASIELTRSELADATTQHERLSQNRARCHEKLQDGLAVEALFQKAEHAQKTLAAIVATLPEQQDRERRLQSAERAIGLRDLLQRVSDEKRHLSAQTRKRDTSHAEFETARAERDRATGALDNARATREDINGLRTELNHLQSHEHVAKELPALKAQLEAETAALERDAKSLAASKIELSSLKQSIEAEQCAIDERQRALDSLVPLTEQRSEREALLESHRALAQAKADCDECVRKIESLVANLDVEKTAKEEAVGALDRLQRGYEQGQATLLARSLTPGDPCPVCGSVDHPSPTRARIDIPEKADLKDARERVEAATERALNIERSLAAMRQAKEELDGRCLELAKRLGPRKDDPERALKRELDDTRQQLHLLQQFKKQQADATERLDKLQSQRQKAEDQLSKIERIERENEKRVATTRTRYDERAAQLPTELREPGAFKRALDGTRTRLSDLENSLERAQRDNAAAVESFNATKATSDAQQSATRALEEQLRKTESEWILRREEAGFDDDAQVSASLLDRAGITELRGAIDQYETQRQQAVGALATHENAISGRVRVNVLKLREAVEAAEAAQEGATRTLEERKNALKTYKRGLKQIEDCGNEENELHEQYSLHGKLADAANGNNPQRLSLQRFVLSVLLDEVLIAANLRLHEMSLGRYALRRRTIGGDARRKGGLELDIFDAWTSDQRPVSTLSGGESFEAALALSLGLAEVSQNHAGGIELDTLFIDEGFGSLDQDSLDRVMTTLMRLRESNRLVGIVSHVQELKERIDTRLEITASPTGSRTRWVIPTS